MRALLVVVVEVLVDKLLMVLVVLLLDKLLGNLLHRLVPLPIVRIKRKGWVSPLLL